MQQTRDTSKQSRNRETRVSRRRARGFAMIEAVVCVIIAAISITASMNAVTMMARTNTMRKDQARASLLARQLLDEIMQYAYEEPGVTTTTLGPEVGETRATYDDVDDFAGYSESPPATKAGVAIPGFTGWTRSVSVIWIDPITPTSIGLNESGMKKITVTVTSPAGKKTLIAGFRSLYGPYETKPSTQITYTSWVGITLQVGSNAALTASGSINLLNQIP
jgi:MSHA pilin protein MshD